MTSNKPRDGKELTDLLVGAQRQPALFGEVARAVAPGLAGWLRKAARASGVRLGEEDRGDLVQTSLLKGWRNLARYDSRRGSAFTWFCTIAGNTLKDHQRRASRFRTVSLTTREGGTLDLPSAEPEPCAALAAAEMRQRLAQALARANPLVRAVWELRQSTTLTFEEMAGLLGRRPGTLACALHRFKLQLRRVLGEEGP
jgi:RNA polymerase sigma factor (sigma-70 family)